MFGFLLSLFTKIRDRNNFFIYRRQFTKLFRRWRKFVFFKSDRFFANLCLRKLQEISDFYWFRRPQTLFKEEKNLRCCLFLFWILCKCSVWIAVSLSEWLQMLFTVVGVCFSNITNVLNSFFFRKRMLLDDEMLQRRLSVDTSRSNLLQICIVVSKISDWIYLQNNARNVCL